MFSRPLDGPFLSKLQPYLTHFSPVLRFIQKPVILFALQIKLLVSTLNATLSSNELNSSRQHFLKRYKVKQKMHDLFFLLYWAWE